MRACLDCKEHIDSADYIVVLGVDSPGSVNHGVGSTPLLSKVHDCIWGELLEGFLKKLEVTDVAYSEIYVLARNFSPSEGQAEAQAETQVGFSFHALKDGNISMPNSNP